MNLDTNTSVSDGRKQIGCDSRIPDQLANPRRGRHPTTQLVQRLGLILREGHFQEHRTHGTTRPSGPCYRPNPNSAQKNQKTKRDPT